MTVGGLVHPNMNIPTIEIAAVSAQRPLHGEERRTDRNEPTSNHHPHEPIFRLCVPALGRRAPQVVLLEPGRDEQRERDADED